MTNKPHTPDTDLVDSEPGRCPIPTPALGGSFEENGQVRLDEAQKAAVETERHSSSGS